MLDALHMAGHPKICMAALLDSGLATSAMAFGMVLTNIDVMPVGAASNVLVAVCLRYLGGNKPKTPGFPSIYGQLFELGSRLRWIGNKSSINQKWLMLLTGFLETVVWGALD